MADFPPWADLTDAVLREIANRLPCVYDRVHFAGVCRPWRESIERLPPLPPPPKLPYLILPLAEQPFFSCVLSGGATHPFFVPEWIRRACYFGSYDGGWIFLSTAHPRVQGYRDYFLTNLYQTLDTFDLPHRIQLDRDELVLRPRQKRLRAHHQRLFIDAATLSSDPFMDGCVVAGFINDYAPVPGYRRQKIAFWRIEDKLVIGYFYMEDACWDAVDVVRHDGAFHFLTNGEHIVVGNPGFNDEAEAPPQVEWEYRCFSSQGRGYDGQHVVARYLVESSGDLLMVVRCSPRPGELTSAFKVFRMAQPEEPEEDGDAPSLDDRTMLFVGSPCSRSDGDVVRYIWRELPSLEGRLLFVGRGCSRSYDADQYPGFEGGVYFFDHRIAVQGGGAPALYPCSDCGKWTGRPALQVERCFLEQDPSSYSSQVWLLNG